MTKTYEKLREEYELEYGQNLLKTYIIESHLSSPSNIPKLKDYGMSLSKTGDTTLHVLNVVRDDLRGTFYVDTFNPRFWLLHTTDRSLFTDRFIKKMVSTTMNSLDHPWLWTQFLENLGEQGIFRGLSLKYDDIFVEDDEEKIPVKTLSMRLWGTVASRVLNILKEDKELRHAVSLSGIGIKRYFDEESFVIDDISFWGKFTAKGTSIDGHFHILSGIKKDYESVIKRIEDEYAITYTKFETGFRFRGSPLTIILKKEIEDLNLFLKELLAARKPFRIWGVTKFLDKDFVKVCATDLHNGDNIDLEISSQWIRIYLPHGSCGNTVLRLFTNIQRYYDSEATLEGIENERIV